LVARDGTIDGALSARLVAAALASQGVMIEAEEAGQPWLVQAAPVTGLGADDAPIATVVIGQKADVGLAGLFRGARSLLVLAAIAALVAIALAAAHIRRNTTR
jgi:hypothetical protein